MTGSPFIATQKPTYLLKILSMKTMLEALKKKYPYQWRVQSRSKDKTKAFCSAYIDARDVMNILDENCPHGWEVQYKELAGFIFAGIGIHTEDGKVLWKWDCGQRIENDPSDNMYDQAGKSAASDSFKRAAVSWGVGRFLYDLEMVTVACDQFGNPVDESGKRIWDLTRHINSRSTPEAPPERPSLDQEKYDAMVKFIVEGKIKEVESALKKYQLTEPQKKLLGSMINNAKADAVTKAAKK